MIRFEPSKQLCHLVKFKFWKSYLFKDVCHGNANVYIYVTMTEIQKFLPSELGKGRDAQYSLVWNDSSRITLIWNMKNLEIAVVERRLPLQIA